MSISTEFPVVGDCAASSETCPDLTVKGLTVEIGTNKPNCDYTNASESIDGLKDTLAMIAGSDQPEVMSSAFEFVLEGLHLNRLINKKSHGDKEMYVGN